VTTKRNVQKKKRKEKKKKKKKKPNTQINPNSIKKPQIKTLAHLENTGMLDNKKTKSHRKMKCNDQ